MTTDSEARALYESIVHGLRAQGWSRIDAEGEALERIERQRARAQITRLVTPQTDEGEE